jgi:hypothetical protein
VDTKILEFLLSYRNRKKRKQDVDSIFITITMENDGKIKYNNFLQQFFEGFMNRFKRNWNEYLYKNLLKESQRSNVLLKKFLPPLRMFFFTILMKNDVEKSGRFIQQIGNFDIVLRELITERSRICKKRREKANLSLVPVVSLSSSQKVRLISFSDENLNNNCEENQKTIEFNKMNFLRKISESKKRIFFGQSSRFYTKSIERKTIDDQLLQFKLITFQLFQGLQQENINIIMGKYLENLLLLQYQSNYWKA